MQNRITPPLTLWLQFHMDDELGQTWTEKQVYEEDVEYVHAGEIRRALMGYRCSELFGDTGLIAATMRCVHALDDIEDLIVDADGTAEDTVSNIRKILSGQPIQPS